MGVPSEKLQHRIGRIEEGIEAVGDTQYDAFCKDDVVKLMELNAKLTRIIANVQLDIDRRGIFG